jgi:hypothetical protein
LDDDFLLEDVGGGGGGGPCCGWPSDGGAFFLEVSAGGSFGSSTFGFGLFNIIQHSFSSV